MWVLELRSSNLATITFTCWAMPPPGGGILTEKREAGCSNPHPLPSWTWGRSSWGYCEAPSAFLFFTGFSPHWTQTAQTTVGEAKSVDPLLAKLECWQSPKGLGAQAFCGQNQFMFQCFSSFVPDNPTGICPEHTSPISQHPKLEIEGNMLPLSQEATLTRHSTYELWEAWLHVSFFFNGNVLEGLN